MSKDFIIAEGLGKIKLSKAKDIHLTPTEVNNFYEVSGNKFILEKILQKLDGNEPEVIFFEHSYFATTLDHNKNAVFVCVWKHKTAKVKSLNKFNKFFSDYLPKTFEDQWPVLWHPNFALAPTEPKFYVSESKRLEKNKWNPEKLFDNEIEQTKLLRAIEFRDGEVFVGNYSFELDFEDKKNKAKVSETSLGENTRLLRTAYDLVFEKGEDVFSYKFSIPILGSSTTDSKFSGQGAIFLYIITKKKIKASLKRSLAIDIANDFKDSSINFIFNAGLDLAKNAALQSRRAAISQVMARNMSHNIGSHVLAKLSTPQSLTRAVGPKTETLKETLEEVLNRVAKFNEYLKLRMDFLADIATSVPTFEVTKNLKNDVVRFLNIKVDTGGTFGYQKLLLENITGNDKKVTVLLPEDKYFVSFPNDMLGIQAFYVIIENIIRNSAKHSNASGGRFNIEFKIVEENAFPDFIGIIIHDDCKSIPTILNLLEKQNGKIREPILKDGVLRQGAWGMLEMKICAAYIRKISPAQMDDEKYNPPVDSSFGRGSYIPPLIEAVNDGDGNLGYKIYLLKPKCILIIDCDQTNSDSLSQEKIDSLKRLGIWYEKAENIVTDKTYNHEFLLIVKPQAETLSLILENENNFPIRKFIDQKLSGFEGFSESSHENIFKELNQIANKADVDQFVLKFWKLWGTNICKRLGGKLTMEMWDDRDTDQKIGEVELISCGDSRQDAVFFRHTCKNYIGSNFNSKAYFEQYGGSSLIAPLLDKFPQNEALRYAFTESIITRIAIVDERIQDIACNEYHDHVKGFYCLNTGEENESKPRLNDILEKAGILILPKEQANLNAENYDTPVKKSAQRWITSTSSTIDFMIIHLGVLERLCDTAKLNTDEDKKREIRKYLNGITDLNPKLKIIVISGRGRPDTLPDENLFLHYSLITQYVLENRSKFHLTQLLYSARKQMKD